MKKHLPVIVGLAVVLNFVSLRAQLAPAGRPPTVGGSPGGPMISAAMTQLFGANSAFTANLETEMKPRSQDEPVIMPSKISYDSGKSRIDTSMSEWKGTHTPAEAMEQVKSMGMDEMTVISRTDSQVFYTVFPGLHAYVELVITSLNTNQSAADFKIETSEEGKETIDGHPCVKKKVSVTDNQGKKEEFTVWAASDLKDFPLKIVTTESGSPVTMSFKDVKLAKPDASRFVPPSDFTKYTNQFELMQKELMKRLPQGGAGGPARGQ